MTANQFNQKYKDFLEEGHYGLAVSNQEFINWLDIKFQDFIKKPGFTYSQIKEKFFTGRFYCEGLTREEVKEVENEITKLYANKIERIPPHVANKIDKMIGDVKEKYNMAVEAWEGCDSCTEGDKHFFINGFVKGYNRAMSDNQPRLMNGDGSEIRKVQSKHVELLDEIKLEETPKKELEQERNLNYRYFDVGSLNEEDVKNFCDNFKKVSAMNPQYISSAEISDEEIYEASKQFDSFSSGLFFQLGANWYRKQLKTKQ